MKRTIALSPRTTTPLQDCLRWPISLVAAPDNRWASYITLAPDTTITDLLHRITSLGPLFIVGSSTAPDQSSPIHDLDARLMVSSLPSTTHIVNTLFQLTIQEPPSLPLGTRTHPCFSLCPAISRYLKLMPLHHPQYHTLFGYALSVPLCHQDRAIRLNLTVMTPVSETQPFDFFHSSIGIPYHPHTPGPPLVMSSLHEGATPLSLDVALFLQKNRLLKSFPNAASTTKGLWWRLAKWGSAGFYIPLGEWKKAAEAYKKASDYEKKPDTIHRRIGNTPPHYQEKYKECIAIIAYLAGQTPPIQDHTLPRAHAMAQTLVESIVANWPSWVDQLNQPCITPYHKEWYQEDSNALKSWLRQGLIQWSPLISNWIHANWASIGSSKWLTLCAQQLEHRDWFKIQKQNEGIFQTIASNPGPYLLLLCDANPTLPTSFPSWLPCSIAGILKPIQEGQLLAAAHQQVDSNVVIIERIVRATTFTAGQLEQLLTLVQSKAPLTDHHLESLLKKLNATINAILKKTPVSNQNPSPTPLVIALQVYAILFKQMDPHPRLRSILGRILMEGPLNKDTTPVSVHTHIQTMLTKDEWLRWGGQLTPPPNPPSTASGIAPQPIPWVLKWVTQYEAKDLLSLLFPTHIGLSTDDWAHHLEEHTNEWITRLIKKNDLKLLETMGKQCHSQEIAWLLLDSVLTNGLYVMAHQLSKQLPWDSGPNTPSSTSEMGRYYRLRLNLKKIAATKTPHWSPEDLPKNTPQSTHHTLFNTCLNWVRDCIMATPAHAIHTILDTLHQYPELLGIVIKTPYGPIAIIDALLLHGHPDMPIQLVQLLSQQHPLIAEYYKINSPMLCTWFHAVLQATQVPSKPNTPLFECFEHALESAMTSSLIKDNTVHKKNQLIATLALTPNGHFLTRRIQPNPGHHRVIDEVVRVIHTKHQLISTTLETMIPDSPLDTLRHQTIIDTLKPHADMAQHWVIMNSACLLGLSAMIDPIETIMALWNEMNHDLFHLHEKVDDIRLKERLIMRLMYRLLKNDTPSHESNQHHMTQLSLLSMTPRHPHDWLNEIQIIATQLEHLPPIYCQKLAPNITHQLPDYPTPASAPILIGLSQWDTIDAVIHLPGIPTSGFPTIRSWVEVGRDAAKPVDTIGPP